MISGFTFDREHRVRSEVGTDLWVGVAGKGPAVLLCDGLGCDGYVWKHIASDLRDNFTVIHWHYRGHGRSQSPVDLSQMSVSGLATDLFRVLDALGIRQVVAAGHSMGVQVLLEAALGPSGDRLAGLMLLCGAPGRPLDTFKNTTLGARVFPVLRDLAHRNPLLFRQFWRRALDNPLTLVATHLFEINAALLSVEEMRPYLERLSSMDPLAFLAMLDDASRHSAEGRMGALQLPTLVVAAERDTFTPMRRSVTMAEEIVGAELFVLPDATHTGPLEWPELLNLRIRKFMAQHLGEFIAATSDMSAGNGTLADRGSAG